MFFSNFSEKLAKNTFTRRHAGPHDYISERVKQSIKATFPVHVLLVSKYEAIANK